MKYLVRDGFVVRLSEKIIHEAGAIIELTAEEFAQHAHKLEEYIKSGKGKAAVPAAPDDAPTAETVAAPATDTPAA